MKSYITAFVFVLVVTCNWAQNTNLDYQYALKISNQTSYEKFNKITSNFDSTMNLISTSSLQVFHPTISYQWRAKNQNFHEIEITSFNMKRSTSLTEIVGDSITPPSPGYVGIPIAGGRSINALISLKYEYIMTFRKMKEKKLVPSFGFAINPFFKHTSFSPVLSSVYPSKEQILGVRFFATPRLTYYVTPKFFVDINLPLCVASTYFMNDVSENPVVPINERRTSTFSFETFPAILNARIGIGIKI